MKAKMQIISSKDNEIVKQIKKLKDKKYRDIENAYIIEGIKLLKEAIAEKADIKQIIICDDCEKTEEISKELNIEDVNYSMLPNDKYFIWEKKRLLNVEAN